MKKIFLSLALLLGAIATSHAATIQFDLRGSTVQNSLHFLNEPSVASGGTGGEIGAGILFDDVALTLDVRNVGWGSSQGFTDLSSTASASHIHGPTAGNNGGGGFTQTAGVLFTLARSSSAVTGGTFTTAPIALTAGQVTDLFNGKWYINLHTANNTGGEIRGFLVPVPEPSTYALAALGCAGLVAIRLRRKG